MEVSSEASESLLPRAGEGAAEYSAFLENFVSDKSVSIVWEKMVCTEPGWKVISSVEAELDSLDFVYLVRGLTTPGTTYVRGDDEGLLVDDFSEAPFENAISRCNAAKEFSPFQNRLISESYSSVTQIVLAPQADSVRVMESLNALLDSYSVEIESTSGRAYLVGEAVSSAELFRVTSRDSRLVYLMPFIAAFVVWIFTRNQLTAIVSTFSSLSTVLFAYSLMGVSGILMTPITSLVVFLLIPLSVAFTIHAAGMARRDEPGESRSLAPFYVACLTTAAGFSVTAISSAPDLRALAFLGTVGVGYILVITLCIALPVIESVGPQSRVVRTQREWFRTSARRQLSILAILTVLGLIGLSKLQIDYNPTEYLPASNPVRADLERSRQEFGAMTVPVVVQFPEGIDDVLRWNRSNQLVMDLSEHKGQLVVPSWYYDDLATIYSAYDDGDSHFPTSPEMFRQFYELFSNKDRDLKVSLDEQEILIRFQIPFLGSSDYLSFEKALYERASELNLEVAAIGRVPSFFRIGHRIAFDVITGLFLILGVVFLIFFAMFRSLHIALAGTVVNLIPILLGLAIFGLFGVSIDLGSAIVAAIAFGIVLDDSTHYLARYVELRARGYDLGTAILRCSREMSTVLLATTAAIIVCFVPLFFVELQVFSDFALLMSATMLVALAADIYLLPGLLFLFHK